jgi:hypothetical protein
VAVYVVSFNYSLEKVIGFTRIPLASITSLQKGMLAHTWITCFKGADGSGAYILSPLQEASRDPAENAGFIINFSPINESSRYSTYSFRNQPAVPSPRSPTASPIKSPATSPLHPSSDADTDTPSTPLPDVEHAAVDPGASEFFAFKALPREFVARGASVGESEDEDEMLGVRGTGGGAGGEGESCRDVVERVVRRVKEQCARVGAGQGDEGRVEDGFVLDKDVVR